MGQLPGGGALQRPLAHDAMALCDERDAEGGAGWPERADTPTKSQAVYGGEDRSCRRQIRAASEDGGESKARTEEHVAGNRKIGQRRTGAASSMVGTRAGETARLIHLPNSEERGTTFLRGG